MPTTLNRLEPQHAKIEPPPGAVAAGVTPDGRQLFRTITPRARGVPRYENNPQALALEQELRDEGKSEAEIVRAMVKAGFPRLWRKNQNTGEPMYPLNRPERYQHEELFTLESEGNWNVRKIPYTPPSDEEIAAKDRERKVAAMQAALPALLVDQGFTADELLAALRRGREGNRQEGTTDTESETVKFGESSSASSIPALVPNPFPKQVKTDTWELSDGRRVKGDVRKARREEAEVQVRAQQAVRDAAQVPEH